MEIKTIHIDDNPELLEDAFKIVNEHEINDYKIIVRDRANFEKGIELLKQQEYDLIILDLCVGDPSEDSEKKGEEIYNQVKSATFSPIVFFTGLPNYVEQFRSDIVRIASKGEGYDVLFNEIQAILATDYLSMRLNVSKIVRESMRSFFWDFIHPNKEIIDKIKDSTSLNYILLRRLANMLSREQIRRFIADEKIKDDFTHPVEFYIYPPIDGEYETGDIVSSGEGGKIYVILTPSCDLVLRANGKRKADSILLISLIPLIEIEDCKQCIEIYNKENKDEEDNKKLEKLKKELKLWLRNNKGERYFFLPETPFLQASLIDFQQKYLLDYDQLKSNFKLLARLDSPFAQAVSSSFTRYYNRIGFPDLDADYMINKLFP